MSREAKLKIIPHTKDTSVNKTKDLATVNYLNNKTQKKRDSERNDDKGEDVKVIIETLENDIDRDKGNFMLGNLKMQLIIFTLKEQK